MLVGFSLNCNEYGVMEIYGPAIDQLVPAWQNLLPWVKTSLNDTRTGRLSSSQ
jgi:hypothetical protein